MYISNIRLGFAANSSSTHSLILHQDAQDGDLRGYRFGWQHFTAASDVAKMTYLAVTVYANLRHDLDKSNAKYIAEQLTGVKLNGEEYIDHQSVWVLPRTREHTGVNLEFFDDFKEYLLQDNLCILGGNDNDERVHLLGAGFCLAIPEDETSLTFTARKDGAYWVLFNTHTGAKVRLSFLKDPPAYTKSTYPELIDMKITNYCNNNCVWCYQDSQPGGQSAKMSDIWTLGAAIKHMGVFEVALGGGDTMSHPRFMDILRQIRKAEAIPNFTTSSIDWMLDAPKCNKIMNLCGQAAYSVTHSSQVTRLAHIIGLMEIDRRQISVQHIVGTARNGVADIIRECYKYEIPLTLLGYKTTGRGKDFQPEDVGWISAVRHASKCHQLPSLSVDTLLAAQYTKELDDLGVHSKMYDTAEGDFSMYIDAVSMQCGPSSYCDKDQMVDIDKEAVERSISKAYKSWASNS